MRNDLHYSFTIPCPENILCWVIFVVTIGALITGVMMLQAARFTLDTDGMPVSQQRFHRLGSAERVSRILNSMDENARRSFRRGLRLDFGFMPCLYGLMISLSILIHRNAAIESNWNQILTILCWVPVFTWLMDIFENSTTLLLLRIYKKNGEVPAAGALLMTICSWLKWISGMAWLLIMLSLLITRLVEYL